MRVRAEVNGHQSYEEYEGELLHVGSAVEDFWLDGKKVPMQVSCVVIKTADRIVSVPMQPYNRYTTVRILDGGE